MQLSPAGEDSQINLYRERAREEFLKDEDENALTSEILGLRVVPAHGSGIWSYR